MDVNNAELKTFYKTFIDPKLNKSDFSPDCGYSKCGRLKSRTADMPDDFPESFPSIEEIVSHPYFDDVRA
jgi:hypothetical protein